MVLLVRATVSIILKTSSIVSLRPMMFANWCDRPSVRFSSTFSCLSWRLSIFSRTFIRSTSTIERLGQVVAGAEAHRLHRAFGGRKRRDHDAEDVLVDPLGGAQDLDAADVGHLDVGDQDVDRFLLERGDRALAVLGEQHLVALAPQEDGEHLPHRSLVVHDEDARGTAFGGDFWDGRAGVHVAHAVTAARAGRWTATVVPWPGCELT